MSEQVILAEQADYLFKEIVRLKTDIGKKYFQFGKLFKKIRDDKLYKNLGYGTMNEFVADPDIAFSRTTVYDYIHMHETYVEKLELDPEEIAGITYSKLRKILSVVEDNPQGWIDTARVLSQSDLTEEVREFKGEPRGENALSTSPDLPISREILDLTPLEALLAILKSNTGKDIDPTEIYALWASQCKICPICGKSEGLTPHHFPRTRGAGTEKWKFIPLCLECHSEAQVNHKEWSYTYRVKIQDYFYNCIVDLIKIIKNLQEEK